MNRKTNFGTYIYSCVDNLKEDSFASRVEIMCFDNSNIILIVRCFKLKIFIHKPCVLTIEILYKLYYMYLPLYYHVGVFGRHARKLKITTHTK